MRTSRRLSAALAVAGLTALTACGSGTGSSSGGSSDGSLEVWSRSSPVSGAVYKKIFAEFTEETGVKVEYTPILDNFEQRVAEAASARDLPDIVINDSGMLGTNVSQGLVQEVDRDRLKGSADVLDRAWEQAKAYDGKYYGVPFNVQSFATFIRKDWREKLGLKQPKTWDDLTALATAFQTEDPDGNGKDDTYGMLVPASTDRGYASWWASSYLWQGGGDFLTEAGDGKYVPAIDSPQSVAAVRWMQDLFCEEKVVVPGALTLQTKDAHEFFSSGKAGVYMTGPYMVGKYDVDLGKKFEVIPSPAGPGGQATLAEGENVYLMAGSKLQEQQRRLAEFLISPKGQKIGLNSTMPEPPVRLSVNKKVDTVAERGGDARWKMFVDEFTAHGRYTPNVPNWQPFRQKSGETLNGLFARCDADPKAELTKLAEEFKQELETQKVYGG
ncbi:ABC transporter substrate-binding protein [Streptomyces phyllanthi]|uniref:Sugar ABC transporter substrate-binding protein n=2 Tax=Streptomyces phyllanthi TaxID=1803180 RepID=A0A5N8WJ55_9ACTN|nr:sugar ABC transporter substrate-binding protein [Streptomyces phyllanthi]